MTETAGYLCATCGDWHEGLPLDGDHALAVEQRDGITPERQRQLVELVLHSDDPPLG